MITARRLRILFVKPGTRLVDSRLAAASVRADSFAR